MRGDTEPWKKIRRGWCLGSEGFVEEMKQRLEERGARRLGYSPKESLTMGDRYLLARWARRESRVGTKWLASQLGVRSVGTMSYGIWLPGKRLEGDHATQKRWKLLQS